MTYSNTTFSIEYLLGNKVYNLDGYDTNTGLTFNYVNDLGWGLPTITPIVTRGAFQDGDTQIGYRLEARTFTLTFFIEADNYFDYLRNRETISRVFSPSEQKGTIRVRYSATSGSTTETITRCIDCYITSGLSFDIDVEQGYHLLFNISFRADDPIFYDPIERTVIATTTPTGTATPYPKPYPVPYGSYTIDQTTTINYEGSAMTYPVIVIDTGLHGFTEFVITNQSTGKFIRMTFLEANKVYTIDLSYGAKTIVDNTGVSGFGKLDPSSTLATFGIADQSRVDDGENIILIEAILDNPTLPVIGSGESVVLSYYNRYIGI